MLVRWKAASPPLAPFALIAQSHSQFSEHPRIRSYSYHLFFEHPIIKVIYQLRQECNKINYIMPIKCGANNAYFGYK